MKTLSFLLSFFVLLFAGKEPAVSVSDTRVDYRLNGAVRFEKNRYFLYSDCYGVAYFDSRSGRSPEYRNNGLPTKVVYPFSEQNAYRPVTGMSVLNGERAAALFSLGLYVTGDGGLSWRQIPTAASNGLKSSNYFSSVALSPTDTKHILLGTSFNGIFETKDGGLTWNPINKTLNGFNSTFYRGADFYEEISALCYGSRPGVFYIAGGYGNGIYEKLPLRLPRRLSVCGFRPTIRRFWKFIRGKTSVSIIRRSGVGLKGLTNCRGLSLRKILRQRNGCAKLPTKPVFISMPTTLPAPAFKRI